MYTWTTVPVFEVFIFFGFLCGGTQYLKTPSESPKVSLLLYNLYVHVCTMCTCGGRVPPVRPHVHTSYMTSHTAHEDRLASIFQFSNLKGICWQDSEMLRARSYSFCPWNTWRECGKAWRWLHPSLNIMLLRGVPLVQNMLIEEFFHPGIWDPSLRIDLMYMYTCTWHVVCVHVCM